MDISHEKWQSQLPKKKVKREDKLARWRRLNGSAKGIYGYFRKGKTLHGVVEKPTGKKNTKVVINGTYTVQWQTILNDLKYTVIEAKNNSS